MHSSRFLIGLISLVSVALVTTTDVHAAKKKDEFADTQVCVKLGLETNHPFQKVCTRKVATVDAAKWTQEKESIHFVFLQSGNAFTSGHIKHKMDGGTAYEAKQLSFCVMEIPAFRGSDEEAKKRINELAATYYYAARDSGHDFAASVKTFKFVERNKVAMFPENCDIVAATGDAWKKSWTKVVEQISRNSSQNTKFGQEFKQSFTNSLNDLSLAFSVTPEQVAQGAITAKAEGQKVDDKKQGLKMANAELMSSGATTGLTFQVFDGSGNSLCHNYKDDETAVYVLKTHERAAAQLREWGVTRANPYESADDVFQAALVGKCRAIMANPADSLQLQQALAKRNISTAVGWASIEEEYLVAATEQAAQARKLAEEEAAAQAERDRLAAIERDKARAERAEMERLAAIERAKTHPYKAVISCGFNGMEFVVHACFKDTEIKLTMDNRAKVFTQVDMISSDYVHGYQMIIDLPRDFSIYAMNSLETSVLSLKILDQQGNLLMEDQAGHYGTVSARN